MGRQKDIQYASRADSHIARQKQIHHLRHIIRELAKKVPEKERDSTEVRELASWGCGTTMHVDAPDGAEARRRGPYKDIDFTPPACVPLAGGLCRYAAHDGARAVEDPVDTMQGVVIHDPMATPGHELAVGVDGSAGKTK